VTGLLQVPLTLGVGAALFLLVDPGYPALYFGVACAFSSTLLVVKYLQAQRRLDTVAGRLCVGLLIFQDIWAIIFLALQGSFSDPSVVPILETFGGTLLLGAIATVIARFVLPWAFHVVAKSPELVVTVALAWCFGVGLLGVEISVSMEMGALIAGATIATSPYAHEVVARVIYLRDFFVTLFFVGLGMSIPVPDGAGVIGLAALVAVIAIALRLLIFLPLLYVTGLDRRNAVAVSAKLAQVSEFCLVIGYLGLRLGHVDPADVSVIIFAFVITAVLTPFLFKIADQLYLKLRPLLDRVGIRSRGPATEVETTEAPRLVLLGFHRVSSALLVELERHLPDLLPRTLVIDTNAATHVEIRKRGIQVVYGDIASADVLSHAGVAAAEVVVSTVPDELLKGTSNERLVRSVRQLAPKATIIANCSKMSQLAALRAAGADHVFRAATEVAVGVLPAIHAALEGGLPSFLEDREAERGRLDDRVEVID
jgi:Kef-type K+ transport system membrane component KefB